MLTLTIFTECSSAIRSRTGETAWHGPHHSAQKSTITLPVGLEHLGLERIGRCIRCHWIPFGENVQRLNAAGRSFLPARYDRNVFTRLPDKPDHPAIELEILERLGARADLRRSCASATAAASSWSFVDGPVTANRFALGVHTAWGRTLKDVFQRYKALRGYDQRYQNGFDCQGLWIEVGVERELGLNSKPRDRGVRARGVRPQVPRRRRLVVGGADARLEAARPVDGLGQRLLHLQRHEHRVHLEVPQARARAGLARQGPPFDGVVPPLRDVALAARADAGRRLPGPRRPVAVRPLPAARPPGRVARHLDDDAVDAARQRRRRRSPRRGVRPARERRVGRRRAAIPTTRSSSASAAPSSSAGATRARSTTSPPGAAGRAPRDPVGRRDDRRGHGHRPHRAGMRRRGLRARRSSTTCRC